MPGNRAQMTFLNTIMLASLAAVAVPIILHLLHRGKRRNVDWAAMRFLTASVALRSRRIMLEEIILLTVRCMLLALLALAMARPFMPSSSAVPWTVVLPAAFGVTLCLALGTAMWGRRQKRNAFFALALSMVVIAAIASLWESYRQSRRWETNGDGQDIALVIDASMSMALGAEDQGPNFDRAVAEARRIVGAMGPDDAVCLILAGPVARRVIASPTADHIEVLDALDRLGGPVGGVADIPGAISAAAVALADGKKVAKRVILITDCQRVGWDLADTQRWRHVAAALGALQSRARLICHTLPLPGSFRNAAVAEVALSRKVIGSDRDVRINVRIANTGSAVIESTVVTLAIDGRLAARKHVGKLRTSVAEAETVSFDYRFRRPGPHVVTARVMCDDDLPADNEVSRVVNVIASLPALIVDGAPSDESLEGAATFISIALAPRAGPAARRRDIARDRESRYLVEPTVVAGPDIARVKSFNDYRLVVLANVSMLPRSVAGRLERFVSAGGGLLIAPGDRARPEFYNRWKQPAGKPVAPAPLGRRRASGERTVGLAARSFTHPSLSLVSEPAYFRGAAVRTYWSLAPDETDLDVRVGGRLDTGDPFLVERKIGKGRVLMTAFALDRHDSNLRTFEPFVAMVHEMAYFLAAPQNVEANIAAGSTISFDLPLRRPAPTKARATWAAPGERMTVLAPSGRRLDATVVAAPDSRLRVDFSATDEVGLYRLVLPAEVAAELDASVSHASLVADGWPFVVQTETAESRLDALDDNELDRVAACGVDLFHARTADEVIAAIRGNVPGSELWRHLVVLAIAAMLIEIVLTRWIAIQRKSGRIEPIEFGRQDVDAEALRELAGMGRRSGRRA